MAAFQSMTGYQSLGESIPWGAVMVMLRVRAYTPDGPAAGMTEDGEKTMLEVSRITYMYNIGTLMSAISASGAVVLLANRLSHTNLAMHW